MHLCIKRFRLLRLALLCFACFLPVRGHVTHNPLVLGLDDYADRATKQATPRQGVADCRVFVAVFFANFFVDPHNVDLFVFVRHGDYLALFISSLEDDLL